MTSNNDTDNQPHQDFYEVIGVTKEATASEIRKAFYKLSRLHHPDKNGGCPEATKKFQALSEAYGTLSDEEKRAEYDAALLMKAAAKEQQERWGQHQGAYEAWYAYRYQQEQQQQAAAEMERMMMLQFLEQQRQAAILQQYLAAELQRQQQEQVAALELLRQEQEKQRAQEEIEVLLQELEHLKQFEAERQERAVRQKEEQERIRRLRQKEEAKRAVFFEPSFVPPPSTSRKSKKTATEKKEPTHNTTAAKTAGKDKTTTNRVPDTSKTNTGTKQPSRRVLAPLGNHKSNSNSNSNSQNIKETSKKGGFVSKKDNVNTSKAHLPASEQAVYCVKKDGTPCGIGRRMGCVCPKHKSQQPQPQSV